MRTGGIRFEFEGNGHWLPAVYVMHVVRARDIGATWVKGSKTNWIRMNHNW